MSINKQILLTCMALLCAVALFEYTNIDIWVEDFFYSFQSKQWVIDKHDQIAKHIFYDDIKVMLVVSVLLLLAGLLFFRKHPLIQINQQGLLIVCISAILVPLVVAILKATTNIPCPNDLRHYGGLYPYVTLLREYPPSFHQVEKIMCYPAGHASGGFAFLSLLFLFKTRTSKRITLFSVMTLGWCMGTYKMLIGDHFLSHTLITMLLSWLIILITAKTVHSWRNESPESVAC